MERCSHPPHHPPLLTNPAPLGGQTRGFKMKETTYSEGDLVEYTGKTHLLHGAVFYEILLLEGYQKGQIKVITRAPKNAGLDE